MTSPPNVNVSLDVPYSASQAGADTEDDRRLAYELDLAALESRRRLVSLSTDSGALKLVALAVLLAMSWRLWTTTASALALVAVALTQLAMLGEVVEMILNLRALETTRTLESQLIRELRNLPMPDETPTAPTLSGESTSANTVRTEGL